ncbi:hypothetical protein TSUD_241270 [Trifolium subterraneum]|uniref:Uncharacterized protein n=1 Tax=Trifolium subterraneum TaxID=3900 RepID=A0A2Z6PG91_TRISU|nr:hypothetical protein TSUD_241270 [Trifolium subterraneum]
MVTAHLLILFLVSNFHPALISQLPFPLCRHPLRPKPSHHRLRNIITTPSDPKKDKANMY